MISIYSSELITYSILGRVSVHIDFDINTYDKILHLYKNTDVFVTKHLLDDYYLIITGNGTEYDIKITDFKKDYIIDCSNCDSPDDSVPFKNLVKIILSRKYDYTQYLPYSLRYFETFDPTSIHKVMDSKKEVEDEINRIFTNENIGIVSIVNYYNPIIDDDILHIYLRNNDKYKGMFTVSYKEVDKFIDIINDITQDDIIEHPFRKEFLTIRGYDIRGLINKFDHSVFTKLPFDITRSYGKSKIVGTVNDTILLENGFVNKWGKHHTNFKNINRMIKSLENLYTD